MGKSSKYSNRQTISNKKIINKSSIKLPIPNHSFINDTHLHSSRIKLTGKSINQSISRSSNQYVTLILTENAKFMLNGYTAEEEILKIQNWQLWYTNWIGQSTD